MASHAIGNQRRCMLFARTSARRLCQAGTVPAYSYNPKKARPAREKRGAGDGAEERTRTSTELPPLAPEASASTNSATSARWRTNVRPGRGAVKRTPRCKAAGEAARDSVPRAAHALRARRSAPLPRDGAVAAVTRRPSGPITMTAERPVGDPERRYQHPIPSREEILAMMERVGTPLKREPLARRFGIHEEQHQRALEHRLKAMVRDGQLIMNRAREYCLVRHLDLVTGTVLPHRDGYGFLRPDDGGDDLYLSAREMRVLWDGDRVAARATEGERGREAHVVEILERKKKEIVGRFARDRGIDYVIEDADTRIEVLIARGSSNGAKAGDMVRVEVLEYPSARAHATGRVTKVIGRIDDPGIETELAILEHGIPAEWPEPVVAAARASPEHVPQKAKQGREDLR